MRAGRGGEGSNEVGYRDATPRIKKLRLLTRTKGNIDFSIKNILHGTSTVLLCATTKKGDITTSNINSNENPQNMLINFAKKEREDIKWRRERNRL